MALAALTVSVSACERAEPLADGSPPITRRLTQDQYKNIIKDTFGAEITFGGRMDPDLRQDGLLAIGTTQATVTPVGFEQYDALARSIAAQVMEPRRRQVLFSCDPQKDGKLDQACTTSILKQAGRALFRRPVPDDQLVRYVRVSTESAEQLSDPYKGIQHGLSMMLASPSFLFQKESLRADGGEVRLDAYSKAARLSFFLWNSGPDEKLFAAADAGELDTDSGLRTQVDRMLANPRVEEGARAFFKDYLHFSLFDGLAKDSVIYPKFSQPVALDAQEQTLRTITDHLIEKEHDYRDLFTTRSTFMSRALGVVYQVPVETGAAWMPYEFPEGDPRAGLLTQLSFTALYSHPGRSSPTLRGKAVREMLMCQIVPIAPANVDFTRFEQAVAEKVSTARDRLSAHVADPACAGCHKIVDPIGFALEHFDGLGATRETEGSSPIDASGTLDGVAFSDAAGLGKALRDNPKVPACLVKQLYSYATGQKVNQKEWLEYLGQSFADEGYKFKSLLRRIALSENFYRIAPAAPAPEERAAVKTGSNQGG